MPIDREASLKKAETLLRQGKLDAAITEYTGLVNDQPDDWSSVNALGDLYVRAGRIDLAIAQFARIGNHMLREGALPKASAYFKKILRIQPGEPQATKGLATIADKQASPETTKKKAEAAAVASARTSQDPNVKVAAARASIENGDIDLACTLLTGAADLYELAGKRDDALALVAEASSLDPANPVFRDRMLRMLIDAGEAPQARRLARTAPELIMVADALEQKGNHPAALDALTEAAQIDPEHQGLRPRLLREFSAAGELDRARKLVRTSEEAIALAEAYGRTGKESDALDVLVEAAGREPDNRELRGQIVQACVLVGDFDRARTVAKTSGELMTIADALRAKDRRKDALDVMAEAVQRDPHNAALHTDFVQESVAVGDIARARTEARTTAERLIVVDGLVKAGQTRDARQLLAEAARKDPANAELRTRAVRETALAGELDEAIRTARSSDDLLAAASAVEGAGRPADALTLMSEASRVDPQNAELRLKVVKAYVAAGDLEQARRTAQTARELLAIAELLSAQGRADEARDFQTEAALREPGNAELRMQTARDWLRAGDLARARSLLQTAAELVDVAELLEIEGKTADALTLLEAAVRLEPQNDALRARFSSELVRANQVERAVALAQSPRELLAIADILDEQGRPIEALEVRADAAEHDPSNRELRARLAKDYAAAGALDRARGFLTREVAGDDPDLLLLLARLELLADRLDEGRQAFNRVLAVAPARRNDVAALGYELVASGRGEAAYACIEAVADVALLEGSWENATAPLDEFVRRVPHHVPALMKLVEICVDGNLDAKMSSVQAQLADAYLASSRAGEARVIAEDLVVREPWDKAHVDRLRKALTAVGEKDPDRVIAERLAEETQAADLGNLVEDDQSIAVDLSNVVADTPAGSAEPAVPPSPGDDLWGR